MDITAIHTVLWSLTGASLYTAAAVCVLKCNDADKTRFEKLTRNRLTGLLLGWFALLMCVPHAAAVAPAFMLKLLYPLAIAVPVLGYRYVDYPAARAVSGVLILCAYNLVHLSFDAKLSAAPFFAVCGWITGAFAIWCSGLPWTWRDIFRKCCDSRKFRFIWAVLFIFSALVFALFGGAVLL